MTSPVWIDELAGQRIRVQLRTCELVGVLTGHIRADDGTPLWLDLDAGQTVVPWNAVETITKTAP
jgi:hypothetical protein